MSNFKYELTNNPIDIKSFNYIIDFLRSLGINSFGSFLNKPAEKDLEDYSKLKNIENIIDKLHENFINNKKFFIQVDSDADGFTSSAIFYNYFKRIYPDAYIEYRLHDGKEHGVILDTVPVYTDVVIIPDAGSNQYDEQNDLSNQGKTVLIMDHHLSDKEIHFNDVVIVNNQLSPDYTNKYLSGAGVVYKVIQAYSEKYHDGQTHFDYIDLAAVGIISDMMDTRTLDNNYIIYYGLNNIKNNMLQALLNKQSYSVSSTTVPNKIDIAFYVTPLINGMIRVGTLEEKTEMFKGFITQDNKDLVSSVSRGVDREESVYDYLARVAYNVKNKQNRIKDKTMEKLQNRIEQKKLAKNSILLVKTGQNEVSKNLTGLVAMGLVKEYNKPSLVLRPKVINGVNYYAGSGRGKKAAGFDSFRNFLRGTGLCEYAEGHDMAFGMMIKEDLIPELIKFANENIDATDFDKDVVEVNYIFENSMNKYMLKAFADNTHIYGNSIPEPRFAFELDIPTNSLQTIGGNNDTLRISYKGVSFIKFKDKALIEKISKINSSMSHVTIIGKSSINEYNGYRNVQIKIDFIEVEPHKEKKLF